MRALLPRTWTRVQAIVVKCVVPRALKIAPGATLRARRLPRTSLTGLRDREPGSWRVAAASATALRLELRHPRLRSHHLAAKVAGWTPLEPSAARWDAASGCARGTRSSRSSLGRTRPQAYRLRPRRRRLSYPRPQPIRLLLRRPPRPRLSGRTCSNSSRRSRDPRRCSSRLSLSPSPRRRRGRHPSPPRRKYGAGAALRGVRHTCTRKKSKPRAPTPTHASSSGRG